MSKSKPDAMYGSNVRSADRFDDEHGGQFGGGYVRESYTDYANLAKSAYTFGRDEQSVPEAYAVDAALSNRNRTVFYNKTTNKAVIAYRGTNPTNLGDLVTDAAIAVGAQALTDRFRNARSVAQQAIDKYGRENVVLTGHSLGGSEALAVGQALDLETHAFNPGKGIDGRRLLFGNPSVRNRKTRSTVYTTGWDPISALATRGNEKQVHVSAPFAINPLSYHDIDNFTRGRYVQPNEYAFDISGGVF
jgi:hypothetical protein